MNELNFTSSKQIIDTVNGEKDPHICSMPALMSKKEAIKNKYSKVEYVGRLPEADSIHLQCIKLNMDEIFKIIGVSTCFGIGCGAIVGAVCKGAKGALVGAGIGAGFGLIGGVVISYNQKLHINKPYIIEYLQTDTEFKKFKERKTEEQYKYFVGFFKNYIEGKREKDELLFEECLCCLTYHLPEYPVFSVHDKERRHVYEKADIERHIDEVETKIAVYIETYSGHIPDQELISNVTKMRINTDPFREHPIAKEDLVYDIAFVKGILDKLNVVMKNIYRNTNTEEDHLILEGVQALILHYRGQYRHVSDSLINQFRDDIFQLHGNYKLATVASEDLRKAFDKVYV